MALFLSVIPFGGFGKEYMKGKKRNQKPPQFCNEDSLKFSGTSIFDFFQISEEIKSVF